MKLIYFIVNTNIFISLAAVALTVATQIQLGMVPQLHPYLFIIFFATLFEYNLHRLVTVIRNPQALDNEKHAWVKQHTTAFYILVGASVLGFIAALLLAKWAVIVVFLPIGLLTLFYSLPIFKKQRNLFRLREIPGLKIFMIAFVWSASTILLPLIREGQHWPLTDIGLMLLERFLFVFAITIPFDIRDMQTDRGSGLKTIPLMIGERKALHLANLALLAFALLCGLHYGQSNVSFVIPAFLLSALSTLLFMNNRRLQRWPVYHYFVLDGTMLLQGLMVCACYYACHSG